jgi:ectoine hydroxylase-related dioxygenase (phytanoyl-CoA dioxygenase family)
MVPIALDGLAAHAHIWRHPRLVELLRLLLDERMVLHAFGAVVSHPGAAAQHVHSDHPPLFRMVGSGIGEMGLPPFAVTVAIPLVDVDEAIGTTRVFVGSHLHGEPTRFTPPVDPELRAGDCLLFDYRVFHGGTANTSDRPRPLLYLVYARPWFFDSVNYKGIDRLVVSRSVADALDEDARGLLAQARHVDP